MTRSSTSSRSGHPNIRERILHRQVVTPLDMERDVGLTEGNIFQGELSLEQLFFNRPVPGWSRFRTPVPGLWLAGSSAHPGGGIMGAPGRLAALAVLADRRGDAAHEPRRAGWDAIVVGGGHNGLVCAAYLARGGLRTLLLERREAVGGALQTLEIAPRRTRARPWPTPWDAWRPWWPASWGLRGTACGSCSQRRC